MAKSTRRSCLGLLLCLVLPRASAITIEIFTDPACTVSLGNSSIYTGFSGICNTATTPDSGLAIGIDFCSPNAITMSIYRFAAAGAAENWGGHFTCGTPAQADARFSLELGACTPVFPCSTCVQQYFRLWDNRCYTPTPPVIIIQQDRGALGTPNPQGTVPFPCGFSGFFAEGRIQSREIFPGICNPRTVTGTPECAWRAVAAGRGWINCASGSPIGCELNACHRYGVNLLSIFPQPTPTGVLFSMFDNDTCSGDPVMTYPNIPVQDSSSTFCTVISGAPMATVARHGLRAYSALPYVTVFSATPSATASPSTTPPNAPLPPNVAAALSAEQTVIVGVGVAAFVLICALASVLAYVVLKQRATAAAPAPSASLGSWAQRSAKALPPLTPAVVTTSPLPAASAGGSVGGGGSVQAWGEASRAAAI